MIPRTKNDLKHGQSVTCTIVEFEILEAKISIDADGKIFICQNHKNGNPTSEKFGFKNSWEIYNPKDGDTYEKQLSDNDVKNLVIISGTTTKETMSSKSVAKTVLGADDLALIEAGYLNEDLTLTTKAHDELEVLAFVANKTALVDMAKAENEKKSK